VGKISHLAFYQDYSAICLWKIRFWVRIQDPTQKHLGLAAQTLLDLKQKHPLLKKDQRISQRWSIYCKIQDLPFLRLRNLPTLLLHTALQMSANCSWPDSSISASIRLSEVLHSFCDSIFSWVYHSSLQNQKDSFHRK